MHITITALGSRLGQMRRAESAAIELGAFCSSSLCVSSPDPS